MILYFIRLAAQILVLSFKQIRVSESLDLIIFVLGFNAGQHNFAFNLFRFFSILVLNQLLILNRLNFLKQGTLMCIHRQIFRFTCGNFSLFTQRMIFLNLVSLLGCIDLIVYGRLSFHFAFLLYFFFELLHHLCSFLLLRLQFLFLSDFLMVALCFFGYIAFGFRILLFCLLFGIMIHLRSLCFYLNFRSVCILLSRVGFLNCCLLACFGLLSNFMLQTRLLSLRLRAGKIVRGGFILLGLESLDVGGHQFDLLFEEVYFTDERFDGRVNFLLNQQIHEII